MSVSEQQVRNARMVSLLLDAPATRSPLAVAAWFGALQAQDAASGHWSIGVRSAGATETDVLHAFERRELVRTWPMRGTIHIVPAADVRWMLELTGVRTLTGAVRRREQLGLTLRDVDHGADALAQALASEPVLTRARAVEVLAEAGLNIAEQRSYHLLWYAAQIGVTCIGPQRGSDQTFVLLDDWAPAQTRYTRSEALTELLHRFVRSHGPVSLKDFVGWTGLTVGDVKAAATSNEGRLVPLQTEIGELWVTTELAEQIASTSVPKPTVVVAPGFDEFMLGYKDRSLHVPEGAMDRIVPGGNGMFRATVIADGIAVGTWKRTLRSSKVLVEVDLFSAIKPAQGKAMTAAFERYSSFLGLALELRS